MLRGIYTAASGMESQIDRQNTIANNLANINTTGFKKDETIVKQFPELELYRKDDNNETFGTKPKENKLNYIGKLGTGANVIDVATQFEQGGFKYTNNDFDFGINGEGFFAVETENGIKATRSGSFIINNQGYLTDKSGNKVLGLSQGGTVGYITGGDINVVGNGDLMSGNLEQANIEGELGNFQAGNLDNPKILVLDIADKENLIKEGANNYSLRDIEDINLDTTSQVKQGFLETSTVNNVKEMVNMIDCTRSYEANQKVLRTQDEMLSQAVSKIGNWS